jgi:hypothetical protein
MHQEKRERGEREVEKNKWGEKRESNVPIR